MSHLQATRHWPATITLGLPLRRRFATVLVATLDRAMQVWAGHAERRAGRRVALAQQALLASLDAHTLRDIGLGDWAASRPETLSSLRIDGELRSRY